MRFFFASVRLRIFFLYALILIGTFSLFGASIYFYSRHQIYAKIDTMLDMRAGGLEDSIRTYLKTRSLQGSDRLAWLFPRSEDTEENFLTIAAFLTDNKLSVQEEKIKIFADIFDAGGNLIASSHTPPLIATLRSDILRAAQSGSRQVYDYIVHSPGKSPSHARAMIHPFIEKGEVRYLIQVRTSLNPVRGELAGISRLLVFSMLTTLLIASWAGLFLVKITLWPVDRMVRKIQNIRGDNLSARIALPDSNDEIRRLARTFNEMLERIEKSFIAQKEIVQDLSHELKTPLTIMRGQLEVALKKPRERAEYEAILRSNLEETARIRRIIDDLLMLARLDSRSTALEVKNVLLPGIIHSVLESTQMLAKEKNIAIAFEGPAEAVLEANEVHLHRLFTNLLENAVKYTPAGGQVLVSFVVEEKGFWVKVRDNGVGIDADRLPHVFDRFYRADNHRRSDSYGLGLSIVKSIVDAHQGQIRIESQPGVGTTFHIYLPKFHPMPFFKI